MTLTVAVIAVVIATSWFLAWMWTTGAVKLAPKLAELLHRCGKEHPTRTHEEWVELVWEPTKRRWFERYGLKP